MALASVTLSGTKDLGINSLIEIQRCVASLSMTTSLSSATS